MAESTGKVLEGVFAVGKPLHISSAQVIRDLQTVFAKSSIFQPLLRQQNEAEAEQRQRSKRRKIDGNNAFKMGHGGTLDPLATGVLIIGIGRGTKALGTFLDCTKTYETVVLFGRSTDTYDVAGKVVCSAPTLHISRSMVEEKLSQFRGNITQLPPIYSALKIDGMKAYEYARSGKQLPRELEARDMVVSECTLTEWFEPGQHDFRWPKEEVQDESIRKLHEQVDKRTSVGHSQASRADTTQIQSEPNESITVSEIHVDQQDTQAKHTHDFSTNLSDAPADAPAARFRLTVSSGFYVRSFAHDLGIVLDSFGTMAELVRSRQGRYILPPRDIDSTASVLKDEVSGEEMVLAVNHRDIVEGETEWAPRIQGVLEQWVQENGNKFKAELNGGREHNKRRELQKNRGRRANARHLRGSDGPTNNTGKKRSNSSSGE